MAYARLPSGYRNGIVFLSSLIFIGGAAILGAGVWTIVRIDVFQALIGPAAGIFVSVYIMIAVGAFMFLLAFLGCVSAIFENRILLSVYAFFLMLIFLTELIGSVLAFVYYPVAREEAQQSIRNFNTDNITREAWNDLQGYHECCGINSYNDWRQRTQFPSLPPSCCMDNIDDCGENSNTRWTEGCDKKIEIFFIAVGSIGFSILLVELLAIGIVLLGLRAMSA